MNEFAYFGSVSHGTLREEDLVPTFLGVLVDLDATRAESLGDAKPLYWRTMKPGGEYADLISDLIDALDEYAPNGYYFGSHPGDGSDFGYWPSEDAE